MSGATHPYDPTEFSNKRVLVTGGTKGIGEAVVKRMVAGGARVLTTARTRPATITSDRFIQADVSTGEGTTSTATPAPMHSIPSPSDRPALRARLAAGMPLRS